MGTAITWLARKQVDVYICGLLCWEKFYFPELAATLLLLEKKNMVLQEQQTLFYFAVSKYSAFAWCCSSWRSILILHLAPLPRCDLSITAHPRPDRRLLHLLLKRSPGFFMLQLDPELERLVTSIIRQGGGFRRCWTSHKSCPPLTETTRRQTRCFKAVLSSLSVLCVPLFSTSIFAFNCFSQVNEQNMRTPLQSKIQANHVSKWI